MFGLMEQCGLPDPTVHFASSSRAASLTTRSSSVSRPPRRISIPFGPVTNPYSHSFVGQTKHERIPADCWLLSSWQDGIRRRLTFSFDFAIRFSSFASHSPTHICRIHSPHSLQSSIHFVVAPAPEPPLFFARPINPPAYYKLQLHFVRLQVIPFRVSFDLYPNICRTQNGESQQEMSKC